MLIKKQINFIFWSVINDLNKLQDVNIMFNNLFNYKNNQEPIKCFTLIYMDSLVEHYYFNKKFWNAGCYAPGMQQYLFYISRPRFFRLYDNNNVSFPYHETRIKVCE